MVKEVDVRMMHVVEEKSPYVWKDAEGSIMTMI